MYLFFSNFSGQFLRRHCGTVGRTVASQKEEPRSRAEGGGSENMWMGDFFIVFNCTSFIL